MYEVFEQLLQKYGVTPYKVAQKAGVTQTALSNWKSGRSTPSAKTLQKIADYFGVTVDYLMTGKVESEKKESEIASKEKKIMEYARKLLDLGIDPDDLESLIDLVEKMQKKD